MLRELHISNLAVIADARIELAGGLNCFTGATGAGKSLVIGAVELLLGMRSPADMLRAGSDEGRVSGVFELKDPKLIGQIESTCDVPLGADAGELLLTRRIYASGRSSVSLNGNPITLAMLKGVAELLVDVHGQHDHQYLLKPSNQLAVLDEFGGLDKDRTAYRETYDKLSAAIARLESLENNEKHREQQLDFARFQLNEIETADPRDDEYEILAAKSQILNNLDKLRKDAGAVHSALYESDGAILDRLQTMASILAELTVVDPSIESISTAVREATVQLSEASFDLSRYLNKLDLDPGELAETNDRLNVINRLLKKYGPTMADVLQLRQELSQQVAQLERAGEDSESLRAQIEPLQAELKKRAKALSTKRAAAAEKLRPQIQSQLADLGMDKAIFSIDLRPIDPGPSGADEVEFMIRTNPGLPQSPLRKIASGGELGRIMLALKGVLAAGDRVSVLVFDEIDANIGGRLGSIIGEKLRAIAAHHQVLCITHLPQIACYANRHLTVRKTTEGNKTSTIVRAVDDGDRIEEIAEMIGGHRITETTRAQARELLETAKVPAKTSKSRRKSA